MTPFFKTTRHDYCIDGVFVRLVNCPIKGDHRQLAPTAEAWLRYALNTWGAGVADLTVKWDEHGRVTHSVEFQDGMTLGEKLRQKQEAQQIEITEGDIA